MKAINLLLALILVSCSSNRVSTEQEVMLGATSQFKKCYNDSYGAKPKPEKHLVNFHLELAADGSVSSAKVEDMNGSDPKLQNCLQDEAKKLTFSADKKGGKRTINQPYNFYAN